MKVQSIQKVIKIGTSAGVTIPAKELKRQNIQLGDEVKVSIEVVRHQDGHDDILKDYQEFKSAYGQTLKNLADR